jgi:hypothetical protein
LDRTQQRAPSILALLYDSVHDEYAEAMPVPLSRAPSTRTEGARVTSPTPKQALAFVKQHGVVLQAARGPVPSFAEFVTGAPIKGSWWAHPQGHAIFALAEYVSESSHVLVCKLVDNKITYVHRRLWPALVKLAARFPAAQLAKIWNEHTASGAHKSCSTPFPDWVPADIARKAESLSQLDAEKLLAACLRSVDPATKRKRAARRGAV